MKWNRRANYLPYNFIASAGRHYWVWLSKLPTELTTSCQEHGLHILRGFFTGDLLNGGLRLAEKHHFQNRETGLIVKENLRDLLNYDYLPDCRKAKSTIFWG